MYMCVFLFSSYIELLVSLLKVLWQLRVICFQKENVSVIDRAELFYLIFGIEEIHLVEQQLQLLAVNFFKAKYPITVMFICSQLYTFKTKVAA